jgi:hypothetical protein
LACCSALKLIGAGCCSAGVSFSNMDSFVRPLNEYAQRWTKALSHVLIKCCW